MSLDISKGIGGIKRDNIALVIVWHVLCTIWKFRNDLNFTMRNTSMESLVDRDKFSSWKWFLTKNPKLCCSSYEWEGEHVLCWHQWEGVRWVTLDGLGLFAFLLWFSDISSLLASLGGLVFCWGYVWCLCVDVILWVLGVVWFIFCVVFLLLFLLWEMLFIANKYLAKVS